MMLMNTVSKTILKSKLLKLTQGLQIISSMNKITFKTSFPYSVSSSVQPVHQTSNPSSTPYTQRAYTPSHMSSQLIQQLPKTPYPTILHQLTLYSQKLLPFDYDYFCESVKWLIPHQAKISLEELIMLFDLAIEYKIENAVLQNSFLNELYCRVYLGVRKELGEYDLQVKETVEKMYQQLEMGSGDHFGVIHEKFRELLEEQEDDQNDGKQKDQANGKEVNESKSSTQKYEIKSQPITLYTSQSKPTHNSSQRKPKSKHLTQQTLTRIINIFLQSNSRHIDFNKLLLQIATIRLDEQTSSQGKKQATTLSLTPEFLLTYTRLAIHLLQLYMTEYQTALQAATQTKPAQYTHRSVKRIYKLQAFYYYEVAKLVEEKKLLENATNAELEMFVELLSGFPIRRRSFRKAIGEVLIEQVRKRELPFDGLMKFFQLSRFDNRLLQHFENKVNGIVPKLPASKPQLKEGSTEVQTTSNPQNKLLVPEVVDESQTQTQGLFKLPASLFRKVTKKKSKPKNKKFPKQNQQEIDLTQPDEQTIGENTVKEGKENYEPTIQATIQKQQISK